MGFFSESELQEHIEKYINFYQLDEEKKELIQEYKDLKEERKNKA